MGSWVISADPVGAVLDTFDGGVDLAEGFLFAGDEAQREVAVESIGAGIGHVLTVG